MRITKKQNKTAFTLIKVFVDWVLISICITVIYFMSDDKDGIAIIYIFMSSIMWIVYLVNNYEFKNIKR